MPPATEVGGFAASQGRRRTLFELGTIVVGFVALLFVGRSVVGWVAERAAVALPASVDARVGDAAAAAVRAAHPSETLAETDRGRVAQVFDELVAKLTPDERATLGDSRVTLIDDDTPNAFALPGGSVFVQSGLLARLGAGKDGDAELRGVLAHELGHAVHRHALRLLARRMAFGLVLVLVTGNGDRLGDSLLAGAAQLEGLRNSREMETDADDFAVTLLGRFGLDAGGLATFLESLDGQPVPDLLSTHPDPKGRAERLRGHKPH